MNDTGVLEGLPTNVADLTGWGAFVSLAMLVVVSFIRGWIRTSREVESAEKRADTFQQAWAAGAVANQMLGEQVTEVMELARMSAHTIKAIQDEHQARLRESQRGGG